MRLMGSCLSSWVVSCLRLPSLWPSEGNLLLLRRGPGRMRPSSSAAASSSSSKLKIITYRGTSLRKCEHSLPSWFLGGEADLQPELVLVLSGGGPRGPDEEGLPRAGEGAHSTPG